MRRKIRYHFYQRRGARLSLILVCCSFIFIQSLVIKLLNWEQTPTPVLSRLNPDATMTTDLRSYSVCHPDELYLHKITAFYRRYADERTCFLIEHLNGGPWWSYVTHEFAEILTQLRDIGAQSDVSYKPLPDHIELNEQTNLTKYFLSACHFDEKTYLRKRVPIIVLIWDVNRLSWDKMQDQWKHALETLQLRVSVFIDDLHFTNREIYSSRQYLFESVASEIFSTYAYIFHNYYDNIPSSRITWLPHAASSLSYRTINRTAENVLFVSGSNMYEWYPCRSRGFIICQTRPDLVSCLKHPTYGPSMKNDSSFYYGGRRYFSYMRNFVFGLGTCQSVHYAIAKLFELPGNGVALVTTADLAPILERLHLQENVDFLTVECSSVNKLMSEIERLRNISKNAIDTVRIKSQEIIHERHLTRHRSQLIHVRLIAQALLTTASSDSLRIELQRWGRDCATQGRV